MNDQEIAGRQINQIKPLLSAPDEPSARTSKIHISFPSLDKLKIQQVLSYKKMCKE